MNRLSLIALYGGGAVLMYVAAPAAASPNPLRAYALIGILLLGLTLLIVPNDRAIVPLAVIATTAVVVAPPHLVPGVVRYAELGGLVLLALAAVFMRGPRWFLGPAVLPVLYLIEVGHRTSVVAYKDAWVQFLMHAIVGVVFLALGALANPRERQLIAKWIIALASLAATYAIVEMFVQPPPLYASAVPAAFGGGLARLPNEILAGMPRSQATMGHPLLLTMLLLTAFGFALRATFKTRRRRRIICGLLIVGIICAGSRSGLAIAVVFLLFTVGSGRFSTRRVTIAAILAGVAVAAAPAQLLGVTEGDDSASHRFELFSVVPKLFRYQDHATILYGNGWASRELLYGRGLLQTDGFVAIDNQVVSLFTTSGLVGLAIFCAAAVVALVRAPYGVRLALGAGLLMFMVFDVLEFPATWAILALVMGMCFGVRDPRQESDPAEEAAEPELASASASRS